MAPLTQRTTKSPAAGEMITDGRPLGHSREKAGGLIAQSARLFYLGRRRPVPAGENERALMKIFRGKTRKISLPRASASLILLLLMLPIKCVAFVCRKGGKLMKRALIAGL